MTQEQHTGEGKNREKGRTNITLDAETAAMLERLVDRIEAEEGFRPTKHQVVHGLIRAANRASS